VKTRNCFWLVLLQTLALAAFAQAQTFSGAGVDGDPYIINSAEDLEYLADLVNSGDPGHIDKYYKLGNNIDLSDYDSGEGWIPIGSGAYQFFGHFDGDGNVISNLYIDNRDDCVGLFGAVSAGSVVANLGLENASVSGGSEVGGIVGCLYGSVANSYFAGTVNGHFAIGGVAGDMNGGSVVNSYSTGDVNGYSSVGGVAGYINVSSVINSYSTSAVSGYMYVGGVAGYSYNCTIIDNAALNPYVKGDGDNIGRVVGYLGGDGGEVLNSNVAYAEAENYAGDTTWSNKGIDAEDGENISAVAISEDGTIGGRFVTVNGWVVANGKLPGFSDAVDFPVHLAPNIISVTVSPAYTAANRGGTSQFSAVVLKNAPQTVTWSVEGNASASTTIDINGLLSVAVDETATSLTVTAKSPLNASVFGSATVTVIGASEKEVVIEMWDSWSDGWAGDGALRINVNGEDVDTARVNGSSDIYKFIVNLGDIVKFYWISDSASNRNAFATYYSDAAPSIAFDPLNGAANDEYALLLYRQYENMGGLLNGELIGLFTVGAEAKPNTDWYNTMGTNFIIYTADELAGLAYIVNGTAPGIAQDDFYGKTIALGANIDLSSYNNWIPIGNLNYPFSGVFNGGKKVISNLKINRTNEEYQGLFGSINGGTVEKLGLENVNVNGYYYVGSIAGNIYGNGLVTNCYSTGKVNGARYVGGIAGYVNNSDVTYSYSISAVNGEGGIVGQLEGGSVANCAALNPEVKEGIVGRVVGSLSGGGTLTNNVAYAGMANRFGNIDWNNKGLNAKDGDDISAAYISTDGTIGGRFATANGWSVENGKLPGFGRALDFPEHLLAKAVSVTVSPASVTVSKGRTHLFKAVVFWNVAQTVTWAIENSTSASTTIGTDGLLTVAADETADSITVIATSTLDADVSDTATVEVIPEFDTKWYNTMNTDFTIYTTEELAGLAHIVNGTAPGIAQDGFSGKTITLGANIDLSSHNNWVPIGNLNYPFSGVFNGNGKVVSNLKINRPNVHRQGLFGYVRYGSVDKLGLENVNINGDNATGGIAGYVSSGNITNSYTTGIVKGNYEVGGVVGNLNDAGSSVANSYSTSAVSGNFGVGGLVGITEGGIISDNAALNPEVKGHSDVGRVVGYYSWVSTLANNVAYADIANISENTTWSNKGATKIDGADIGEAEINADGTINGLFVGPVWTTANGALPGFGKTVDMPSHLTLPDIDWYIANPAGPNFIISTAEQLAGLARIVNGTWVGGTDNFSGKTITLGANINLDVYDNWMPIGNNAKPFKGTFNGNGKVISNLKINRPVAYYQGLFGNINGGTVNKLGLENVNISAYFDVGGIAGFIQNISSISNSYTTGTIKGNNHVGGIAGSASATNISNSYSTAAIEASDNGGGIAGSFGESSVIANCAALNSKVKAGNPVGRVVGNDGSTLTGNIAYAGMENKAGDATWSNKGLTSKDGADIIADIIFLDSTLGGKFTDAGVWTLEGGKLPGFESAIAMPSHISDAKILDVAKATVVVNKPSYVYTGSEITPDFTVIYEGIILKKDVHYTYAISSVNGVGTSAGTNAGTVTFVIAGKGMFTGTNTNTFVIERKPIAEPTAVSGLTYTGLPQTGISSGTGYTLTNASATNAGTHTATATPDGNHQWNAGANVVAARNISWSIAKIALTITAKDMHINLGEAPIFTVLYSGFANGETESVLGGKLLYNCEYPATNEAGSYGVTPGGLTSPNYEITFVEGTLTVDNDVVKIYATGSTIILQNVPKDAKINVYNLLGERVYSRDAMHRVSTKGELQIPVQTKGMYVAKINGQTLRIVVR